MILICLQTKKRGAICCFAEAVFFIPPSLGKPPVRQHSQSYPSSYVDSTYHPMIPVHYLKIGLVKLLSNKGILVIQIVFLYTFYVLVALYNCVIIACKIAEAVNKYFHIKINSEINKNKHKTMCCNSNLDRCKFFCFLVHLLSTLIFILLGFRMPFKNTY